MLDEKIAKLEKQMDEYEQHVVFHIQTIYSSMDIINLYIIMNNYETTLLKMALTNQSKEEREDLLTKIEILDLCLDDRLKILKRKMKSKTKHLASLNPELNKKLENIIETYYSEENDNVRLAISDLILTNLKERKELETSDEVNI